MSNALYDKGREGFLAGEIDWDTDVIKAVLIDAADYTVNLADHQFLSDIPAAARVATSAALTGKTVANGVADAADLAFLAISGDPVEALVIYQDTGSESTSRLIAYIDTTTGLPVTPNGGDINVAWDNGDNKIFKL
jgi:phage tail sheath gpL-like